MSFKNYKFADLVIFSFLALLGSFISEYVFLQLEHPMFYLNFGLLIGAITLVRWNLWGTIPFVLSGVPMLIFRFGSGELWYQILFYVAANATLGLSFISFRFFDKNKIHTSFKFSLLYLMMVFLSVILGKSLVLTFSGEGFFTSVSEYIAAELFTFSITTLAFLFINKFSDGLVVDMKNYILSVQGEKEKHD